MTKKILLKFAKKGINLSPEAYNKIMSLENPLDFSSSFIVKLKSEKFNTKDLLSVSGETVDKFINLLDSNEINKSSKTQLKIQNKTEDKIPSNQDKSNFKEIRATEENPIISKPKNTNLKKKQSFKSGKDLEKT
jgi:DNA polymerase II small subunit